MQCPSGVELPLSSVDCFLYAPHRRPFDPGSPLLLSLPLVPLPRWRQVLISRVTAMRWLNDTVMVSSSYRPRIPRAYQSDPSQWQHWLLSSTNIVCSFGCPQSRFTNGSTYSAAVQCGGGLVLGGCIAAIPRCPLFTANCSVSDGPSEAACFFGCVFETLRVYFASHSTFQSRYFSLVFQM